MHIKDTNSVSFAGSRRIPISLEVSVMIFVLGLLCGWGIAHYYS